MTSKLLYLFTRTPLHVGAGSSVGAIDQPIQRERHTGFPIIPASSLKGTFADEWNQNLLEETNDKGESKKVRVKKDGTTTEIAWLFGSDNDKHSAAGSLLFSEARLLAFPIRSAKGSFAWITCPLMLQRAKRDGVIACEIPAEPDDEQAIFKTGNDSKLALPPDFNKIVLEDYCFTGTASYPDTLAKALAELITDKLFASIIDRLVIVSNGTMSHFVTTACEVAQHVKISDETGTAEGTGLFNQENVPADTLFYFVLNTTAGKGENKNTADQAWEAFKMKIAKKKVFQFGGDASTGLGFCSVSPFDKTHKSS